MKKMRIIGSLLLGASAFVGAANAQSPSDVTPMTFEKAFQKAVDYHVGANPRSKGAPKYLAPPVEITNEKGEKETINAKQIVKMQFELEDGTRVNPKTHVFKPDERFKIVFSSAQPGSVYIYQKYGEKAEDMTQVYPLENVAKTMETLKAGDDVALPVKFHLDDNLADENVTFVFVRPDDEAVAEAQAEDENVDANGNENDASGDENERDEKVDQYRRYAGTIKSICIASELGRDLKPEDVEQACGSSVSRAKAAKIADALNRAAPRAKMVAMYAHPSDTVDDDTDYLALVGEETHAELNFVIRKSDDK